MPRLAVRLPTAAAVERLVGLWALATLLQTWVGHRVGQPSAPGLVRGIVAHWSTTGRLSVWARGRLALAEPSGQLVDWLDATLVDGAARLVAVPGRLTR